MLKQWLGLQVVRGTEAALEALTIGEVNEEFARVLHEAQHDLAKGAVASFYNLVDVVSTARDGFKVKPRYLQVMIQRGNKVSAYHAPAVA